MTIESIDTSSLASTLPADFTGRLVTAADTDYDALREVLMGDIDRRPALILRPRTAEDVSAAIRGAARLRLPLAVRGGGHSGAGHSATEGGIVIDMRDMKALEVDANAGTAWAETGLTAGEVSGAVTDKGLAIGFGDAASVGIGGITLGGGVGYLSRRFGLTIDSLLAADIVSADGARRRIDESSEPDLFWAIRGGGGNFGVVTRLQFRLSPLPAFTGGMLVLPATAETIAGFVAAAENAPNELSTIANVMPAPPMPFLPAEQHGRLIIMAMMAFAGEDERAEAALRPFRALAVPLADTVKPGPFMQMYPPEEPGYRPIVAMRTFFADRVGLETAGRMLDLLETGNAPMRAAQLRVLGGAIASVPNEATAYAHRDRGIMGVAVAFHNGHDKVEKQGWVSTLAAVIAGDSAPGAYANFLGDEGEARVREAYPGTTWTRLRDLKRRYDPDNLFRLNQNIPPTS